MAKKRKTNIRNKASALETDPRTNMYEGKDRVLTTEDETTEATEDTSIEATMEATPEVESFMDSSKPEPQTQDAEVQGDDTEVKYKKRYDDLKKYYDSKLSEWKQEKETLQAQMSAAEEPRKTYAPPKTAEELENFKEQYPDVYQVVETISHKMASQQVEDLQAEIAAHNKAAADKIGATGPRWRTEGGGQDTPGAGGQNVRSSSGDVYGGATRGGWNEAAEIIVSTMNKTISEKKVTYDFERLMDGATLLKCSEFGDALINNM